MALLLLNFESNLDSTRFSSFRLVLNLFAAPTAVHQWFLFFFSFRLAFFFLATNSKLSVFLGFATRAIDLRRAELSLNELVEACVQIEIR